MLVGVIIGEFLSARAGLGYLITYSAQTFTMTVLMTSIMILCLLSWLLYQAIACVEKEADTIKCKMQKLKNRSACTPISPMI